MFKFSTTVDNTQTVIGNLQQQAELVWYRTGRPYYKIFPNLLPYFISTRLDVPCEFFRLPFPVILIRLPVHDSLDVLKIDDKHYVKTILVSASDDDSESFLFDPQAGVVSVSCRQVVMWIDINETESAGGGLFVPVLTYQQLLFTDLKQTAEWSIERCREKTQKRLTPDGECLDDGGILVPQTLIEACWRIVIAVSFLSTGGDKIVEFDVLNRDLLKYLQAISESDESRQKQLIERAKRNGKLGYTLGRELPFPSRHADNHASGESGSGEHRELSFQHQRGAHWHWVRHGPGRAMMKLVFYKQVTVRPDLPTKLSAKRGYRAQ